MTNLRCETSRALILLMSLSMLMGASQPGCRGGKVKEDPDARAPDGTVGDDGGPPDGGPLPDAEPPPDGGPVTTCIPTTSLETSLIQADPAYSVKVVDTDEGVLLAIPEYIGPSTDHLLGVSLAAGQEAPVVYSVSGEVPLIKMVAATYDPAAGHILGFGYFMARPGDGGIGDHMELFTLTLSGASATLALVPSTAPPTSQGSMFNQIYPEGDGVHYRAFRFAQASVRVAVSGGTANWEPEVPLTVDGTFDWNHFAHDPTGHRLLVFGELTIEGVPPEYTEYLDPTVFELSLAGGTHWSRVMASGEPPARMEIPYGIVSSVGIWDDVGARLVVLHDHEVFDPWFGDYMTVTGVWALSASGIWSVVNENTNSCCVSWWGGVVDPENRRALNWSYSGLTGIDLAEGSEGQGISVPVGEAVLTAGVLRAAFDTSRGALLATGSQGLVTLPVRGGDPVWTRADGHATFPAEAVWGHTLAYDAVADRAVLFGGASDYTSEVTNAVWTLVLGVPSPAWVTQTTLGPAPAARREHAAILDEATRTLYVVGGFRLDGQVYTHFADMVALDLGTMTWRELGTLPVGRARPLLHLGEGGAALHVLFGAVYSSSGDPAALTDAFRVDTATGAVTPLAVSGDLPTLPSGYCTAVSLPSGLQIVSPEPEGTEIYTVTFGPSGVSLSRAKTCEDPRAFGWGDGVVDPQTGAGYVVGRSLWRLTAGAP